MAAGIHNTKLWKLQNGWDVPTDEEAKKLAKAFGLPPTAASRFKTNLEIPDEEIKRLLEL